MKSWQLLFSCIFSIERIEAIYWHRHETNWLHTKLPTFTLHAVHWGDCYGKNNTLLSSSVSSLQCNLKDRQPSLLSDIWCWNICDGEHFIFDNKFNWRVSSLVRLPNLLFLFVINHRRKQKKKYHYDFLHAMTHSLSLSLISHSIVRDSFNGAATV